MKRIFILAGTHEQAQLLAQWHDMGPNEWRYVGSENVLLGLRYQTLWLFGTWARRRDARVCMDIARVAEFKVFTVEDDRYVAAELAVARAAPRGNPKLHRPEVLR